MSGCTWANLVDLSRTRTHAARRALRLGVFACIFSLHTSAYAQHVSLPQSARTDDETLFSVDSPFGDIDYVTGSGLRLGRTGLTVGGFTTLEIDREEGEPASIELDGVNFLVLFEPFDFFTGFAEIELGKLFAVETNSDDVESDLSVEIERLYGDFSLSDALNLRFGKFQTPVGRWNLVPAEPFVWTASEPVVVETAFDEHQTGAAFFGSVYPGANPLSYWVYGQVVDPLDPSKDPPPVDRSVGGRVEYGEALGAWSLGASFLASEKKGRWNYLGGLDAFARVGPLELQSELAIVKGNIPGRNLWGIYAQGVYDLGDLWEPLDGLYFVGRYEHFDASGARRDSDVGDVGLTWLPLRWLNVKATYRFADHQTDEARRGLTASISVLF